MRKLISLSLIAGMLLASCATRPSAGDPRPAPPANGSPSASTVLEEQDQAEKQTEIGVRPVSSEGCSTLSPGEGVVLQTYGNQQDRTNQLVMVDPATGQQVCGQEPVSLPYPSDVLISRDGRVLAFLHFGDYGYRDNLMLLDLQSWEKVPTEIKPNDYVSAIAFSPDSRRLALAYPARSYPPAGVPQKYEVVLVDTTTGKAAGSLQLPFTVRKLFFTPDSASIIAYGGPHFSGSTEGDGKIESLQAQVALVNAADGALAWQIALPFVAEGMVYVEPAEEDIPQPEIRNAGVSLSPDGNKLYLVHAGEDRLTTLELDSRSATTVEIHRQQSWIERLLALTAGVAYAKLMNGSIREAAISPDGKTIYAVGFAERTEKDQNGDYQFDRISTGLLAVDVETGAELGRLETEATSLEVAPGGRYLLLRRWTDSPHTEVVEAASLEVVSRLDGQHTAVLPRLDAGPVFMSVRKAGPLTKYTLFDASTMVENGSWTLDGSLSEQGFLPWPRTY